MESHNRDRQNYNIRLIVTQQLSLHVSAGIPAEGVPLDDSLALTHHDPLVGFDVLERFDGARRPTDADVGLDCLADAEVDPKVALGNMIAAAAHFIDLFALARGHGEARAQSVATGRGHGPHQQRVAARAEVRSEEHTSEL